MHDLFVAGQVDSAYLDSASIRPMVAESWRRSLAGGVNPDGDGASSSAVTLRLARMRDSHPLASALPVIRRLLVDDATDSGVVVPVTAADGTLLWVEGDPKALRKAVLPVGAPDSFLPCIRAPCCVAVLRRSST